MERALTEPGLGYYATSDVRPTRAGDFLTAPELHPLFARCVGRFVGAVWRRLGRPEGFTVEEHGAGRGTLRERTLQTLAREAPGAVGRVRWRALDLRARGDGPEPTDRLVGLVLANEFLDALPVHRVTRRAEGLREAWVTWEDGWFAFREGPLSSPALEGHLEAVGTGLAVGQVADVCLAAPDWMMRVGGRLGRGVVLVIDYGHDARDLYGPRRLAGTLMAYRDHRASTDPFAAVGRQDLTAHVDVTSLSRAAGRAGLVPLGDTIQARFLAGLGLGAMLAEIGRAPGIDPADYVAARAAVARLMDPRHLGGFRVLAWGRDVDAVPPLPGLDAGG